MNKQSFSRGHVLIIAAVSALVPLASASAEPNPETGAFYNFGAAQETKARGAAGPIRSDDPSGSWQAGNPELGAFYGAHGFGGAAQTKARGVAGPVRTDDAEGINGVASLAGNPETGRFYSTSW